MKLIYLFCIILHLSGEPEDETDGVIVMFYF